MNGVGITIAFLLLAFLTGAAYLARERRIDRLDDGRSPFNWNAMGPARQGHCPCGAQHASGTRIHPRQPEKPFPGDDEPADFNVVFEPSPVLARVRKLLPPDFDPDVDSGVGHIKAVR